MPRSQSAPEPAQAEFEVSDEPSSEEPRKTTKQVVKYEGLHSERVIEARDWKQAGVEDQQKTVWDALNDWQIDASEFTDRALNYVKNLDQTGLVVKEVEVPE